MVLVSEVEGGVLDEIRGAAPQGGIGLSGLAGGAFGGEDAGGRGEMQRGREQHRKRAGDLHAYPLHVVA